MGLIRPLVSFTLAGAMLLPGVADTGAAGDLPHALQPGASAPLEGTTWRLQRYLGRGEEREPGPEVAAWMQLRGGRLAGSGGCTRIRGSYASMGEALKINLGTSTKPACGEPTVLVQDALVDGLEAAVSYALVPGDEPRETTLRLRDTNGRDILDFAVDDAADLSPGEWRLEAYTAAEQRVVADATQPAVLSFRPRRTREIRRRVSGQIVGSTGCNGIVGSFERRGDVITFGPLDITDAPCAASMAEQESAMLETLDASSLTLSLPPDRLVLLAAESGQGLEFVSAQPLEGSTWLLEGIDKAPSPRDPVTLWLRSGEASGEGPCGSYGGEYTTDGVFITFTSLQGASDADCDDRAAERRLLGALRKAVLMDRSDGELLFQDAAGKDLARFTLAGGP